MTADGRTVRTDAGTHPELFWAIANVIRQAYPGPTWERLVAVKRRWDPTNLFRHDHNIPPGRQVPERVGFR